MFRATLNRNPNVSVLSNEGLYADNGGGLLREVVRKGDILAAPSAAVSRILQFWAINDSSGNRFDLFTAKLRGAGVNPSNDCALFFRDESNNITSLLREGDSLPGTCSGERVGRILRVDADPFSGSYAVIISVADATPQNNQALLLGNCMNRSGGLGAVALSTRLPSVMVRKGRSHQQFFGNTTRIVSMSLSGPNPDRTGAGGGGMAKSVNDSHLLGRITDSSGKTALVLISY